MKYLAFLVLLFIIPATHSSGKNSPKPISVLLLSGRNNHDWQQTTPFIQKLLIRSGLFTVSVTEKPDTLKMSDVQKFDVVLNNWNSLPENDLRWSRRFATKFRFPILSTTIVGQVLHHKIHIVPTV